MLDGVMNFWYAGGMGTLEKITARIAIVPNIAKWNYSGNPISRNFKNLSNYLIRKTQMLQQKYLNKFQKLRIEYPQYTRNISVTINVKDIFIFLILSKYSGM